VLELRRLREENARPALIDQEQIALQSAGREILSDRERAHQKNGL